MCSRAPGVIIKDVAFGWGDFTQVTIMAKVKELPISLRDDIIK